MWTPVSFTSPKEKLMTTDQECLACQKKMDDLDILAWAQSGLPLWRLGCKDCIEKLKQAVQPFVAHALRLDKP